MKEIEIDGVVHEFPEDFTDADIAEALGTTPPAQMTAAPEEETLPPTQSGPEVPPGVMSTMGTALRGANAMRPAVASAAKFIAHSPITQRAAGAATGSLAFTAGQAAGLPPIVNGPLAITAYGAGRRYAGKAAKFLEKAVDTAMPRVAGKFAALPAGRAVVNKLATRTIPGIGNALMAADAGQLLWERLKGIPQAIRDNPNMLSASPSYRTPEEEALFEEMRRRESGR